jgi:hypothetical protein
MSDGECAGEGNCHGCLKWCSSCGDVGHVCDTRLRGERCDEHPVPPRWETLRRARAAIEAQAAEAKRVLRQAEADLAEIQDQENARREYDRQMAEVERRMFEVNT